MYNDSKVGKGEEVIPPTPSYSKNCAAVIHFGCPSALLYCGHREPFRGSGQYRSEPLQALTGERAMQKKGCLYQSKSA